MASSAEQIRFSYQETRPKDFVAVSFAKSDEIVYREQEVVIGFGREALSRRKLILLIRKIIVEAKLRKLKKFSLRVSELPKPETAISPKDLGEFVGVNFEMANFEFVKYKTKPEEGWNFVTDVSFAGASKEFRAGIERGQAIGQGVNACRALANTPGGEMTPPLLAVAAKSAAKGTGIKVKILGRAEMKKLGMGAVLGVAQGSDHEPKFIIMEYAGGKKGERTIVLAGKGVTFDTGGLNLKPEASMYEMHMDMSGGAAVIHTVVLAAKLKLKKNIVALVPAVENMPSGSSYHPGDVLRSMSGKTIEVLNTDAEGRVILADALHYAKRYDPALVVDVATLTGAAMVALGPRASAIFTKDEKLEQHARDLGEESGDYVWPLPLWDEYEEDIKGTFGDWANTGKTRYGGAITAAMFLYQFTKDYPKGTRWLHIDIASHMTAADGENLAKGAAGSPVRLLVKLLQSDISNK